MDELKGVLTSEAFASLAPEPEERTIFFALTLLSPVVVGLICLIKNKLNRRHLQHRFASASLANSDRYLAWRVATRMSLAALLVAVPFGIILQSHILHFVFQTSILFQTYLAAWSAILALYLATHYGRSGHCRRVNWALIVSAAAITYTCILPRGLSIRSVSDNVIWNFHFQSVFYPVTQVYGGYTSLADFTPLYGLYAELLLPIFKLIGLSVTKFIFVLVGLQFASSLLLFAAVAGLIKNRIILLILGLTLAFACGGTWGIVQGNWDPYFANWPIRFLFPAVGIWLFLRLAKRPTPGNAAINGGWAALALVWNLDSGLAVAGSLIGVLVLRTLASRKSREFGRWLRCSFWAAISLAIVLAALTVHIAIKSDGRAQFSLLLEYPTFFSRSGYYMLPMSVQLHPWMLVASTYLLGLCYGLRSYTTQKPTRTADAVTHLSILGAGLFLYYQGRSHDFNLTSVWWPALIVSFILVDRTVRAVRGGLLREQTVFIAAAPMVFGLLCCITFVFALSAYWESGADNWSDTLGNSETPIMERIKFIKKSVGSARECAIFSSLQAVYFGETGLRSALPGPSITELFFRADRHKLLTRLAQEPAAHVFVDRKLFTSSNFKSLALSYEEAGISTDGAMLHLVPRSEQMRLELARQTVQAIHRRLGDTVDTDRGLVEDQAKELMAARVSVKDLVKLEAGRAIATGPQTAATTVQWLYQRLLCREGQPAAIDHWAAAAKTEGFTKIIDRVTESAVSMNKTGEDEVPCSGSQPMPSAGQ